VVPYLYHGCPVRCKRVAREKYKFMGMRSQCFTPVKILIVSALKMEVLCSSEKVVYTYHIYVKIYIFLIGMGGVESNRIHSALQPPIGLLCQLRVIMMMEKLVE
jgi:hypothetical protein